MLNAETLAVATPAELKLLEKSLVREQALLSPLDFAVYVSDGRVRRFKHTELLSRYAKALVEHALYDSGIGTPAVWTPDPEDPEDGQWRHPETGEEAHNIIVISAPPQHGKSLALTETVPAWYLEQFPDRRVIATGYEADFAKNFGRANRDKIEACPEFGISVSKESRAADNWNIDGHDGGMMTAGAGGPITGRRGDLIIIDDPVKNSEDALSEAARRKNKQWWQSTIKSRVRTDTLVIIIQTRWHEDDLAGHVEVTERCFKLNLPALAFETAGPDGISVDPDTGTPDPLGRKPGQALCSALQTRSMLLSKQETGDGGDEPGGMLWFSALYQGKPNIEGGGQLRKPFGYFTSETNFSGKPFFRTVHSDGTKRESYREACIYFITADLAVSSKTTADYTVFTLFAWTPHNELLVADVFRERVESTEHVQKAAEFWKKSRTATAGAGIRFFGVENKTYGLSLIQALKKDNKIPVKKLEADADKIARANPVGMMIKEDQFFLPAGHVLLPDIEKEMMGFPNGTHDDIVDTFGYGARESRLLPRRKSEEQLTEPEKARRSKRKKNRYHPIIGRL